MSRTVSTVILLALAGGVAFALVWYLLGFGLGIMQRGYNRTAPARIHRVDPPQPPNRSTYTWESFGRSR